MPNSGSHIRPTQCIAAMLRSVVCVCSLLAVLLSGCANQQQELIESELRRKESALDEMKTKLGAKDSEVQALEIELEMCQRKHLQDAKGKCPSTGGTVLFVQKITLGRATGGYRQNDASEADDALLVMLEPRDADDSTIKAPGSAKIEVFEVTTAGLKSFLSAWDFAPRELRRLWESPLIGGAGYRLVLPWKAYPTTERIRIVVHFTTLDGQAFEAEKEATVRLLAPSKRKQANCPPDAGNPAMPIVNSPPTLLAPDLAVTPTAPEGPTRAVGRPTAVPAVRNPARAGSALPPPPMLKSEEELPRPEPLRSPVSDPPLSFEMKPFSPGWEPIIQVGYREDAERPASERVPKLGAPSTAKNPHN